MDINRDFYLNQLKLRENNGMIKVITGVRRCGKSYLLFNIFSNYLITEKHIKNDHIIKIAFDSIENDYLREPHTLYNYIKKLLVDNDTYYILLDEIQYVERFYEVLNSLLRLNNMDVYVTGSNSKFLSSDILTEFRGRGDEIRVYPLSFSEFMQNYSSSEERGLYEYMTFGGLPRILSMTTDEQKMKYLTDLFKESYIKDIIEHNKIKNTSELEDLLNMLASSVGSLINPRKLENTFRSEKGSNITDKTIKSYMDYIKDAFIIDTAIRYDIKGKKYINTPFKVYFVDTGLRNARLGFRQIEETHLMENIIFNELKKRGFSVDVGVVELRDNTDEQRTRKSLEVDFIAYKGNNKYYIQSAYFLPDIDKKTQEERPLLNINDSFKKIIIVWNYIKLKRDENGITTMSIIDFLMNDNSLNL